MLRRVLAAVRIGLAVHVAPEPAIALVLRQSARRYLATDLEMASVTVRADLRHLPLATGAADLVFASHVLEHIRDDRAALTEIHRVLAPAGLAILPVPIKGEATIEYSEARLEEHGHVRAPGMDYLERIASAGFTVVLFRSRGFDWMRFQLMIYEPGSGTPSEDLVPVCHKAAAVPQAPPWR